MRANPQTYAQMFSCEDMYIPPRVISAAIKIADKDDRNRIVDRLNAFMREDPTLKYYRNSETDEDIL